MDQELSTPVTKIKKEREKKGPRSVFIMLQQMHSGRMCLLTRTTENMTTLKKKILSRFN